MVDIYPVLFWHSGCDNCRVDARNKQISKLIDSFQQRLLANTVHLDIVIRIFSSLLNVGFFRYTPLDVQLFNLTRSFIKTFVLHKYFYKNMQFAYQYRNFISLVCDYVNKSYCIFTALFFTTQKILNLNKSFLSVKLVSY